MKLCLPLGGAVALVLLAGSTCGLLVGQAEPLEVPRGTVRVQVAGPFGAAIDRMRVHLYTPDRSKDLLKEASRTEIANVPYGRYVVVVEGMGGGVGVREISVNTPFQWVVVGIPMPMGTALWPPGNLVVRGTVKGARTGGTMWWVRASGVFLHARREAPVAEDGSYSIDGLEMGRYVVEVFEGGELRHTRTIEIDTNRIETVVNVDVPVERKR